MFDEIINLIQAPAAGSLLQQDRRLHLLSNHDSHPSDEWTAAGVLTAPETIALQAHAPWRW